MTDSISTANDVHAKSITGIPADVNPATDLAARVSGPEPTWNDSIYFASRVQANGREFGVLVHTIKFTNMDRRLLTVTVTDNTGLFKTYDTEVDKDSYIWSTEKLDIKMPDMSWTGDMQTMQVKATMPWGSLEFQLKAEGPAMFYAGTGAFPLVGDILHEFAFPSMTTTGTLTIEGANHEVSGLSWMDRQWGPVALNDPSMHWTWMNLSLPNGDKLAIWDAMNSKVENSWATVLHPDGSYNLAAVKPLAEGAEKIWTSPVSGQVYPTRWNVEIPALKAILKVEITGAEAQEIVNNLIGGRYEGTASFSGTYQGEQVSGKNYVEMVGHWLA